MSPHRHPMPAVTPADPRGLFNDNAASPISGARTTRSVPRAPWRFRAPRRAGPHGLSVLLPLQVTPHRADRFRRRRREHPRRGGSRSWHGHNLGCRHPHLGGEPDRRSARQRSSHFAPDGRHPLRDPQFHRPRRIDARLSAPQGCPRPAAVDHGRNLDTASSRRPPPPFLLDQ